MGKPKPGIDVMGGADGMLAAEGSARLVFLERQWALPQLARHQFPGCLAPNQNGNLGVSIAGPVADGSSGITSSSLAGTI